MIKYNIKEELCVFSHVVSWRAATPQGKNRIAKYIENNVAEWDLETKNT